MATEQFCVITRYATASAEAAEENQRRVEAMFAELEQTHPDNINYLVLRLADDSFLHVANDHGPTVSIRSLLTNAATRTWIRSSDTCVTQVASVPG